MPTPSPAADLDASAQLTALLELLDDGVVMLDAQCRVIHANTAFVTLCGVGVAPRMLLATAMPAGPATFRSAYREPAAAAAHFERALACGRAVRDQRHTMTGGRVVAHDYRPVTVAAATVGHLWVLRDLTGRGATATAPPDTPPDTARRLLASAIAHELRTPATSVAAFAEVLADPDADADARHRAVAAIDRNAARLQLLAADLLLLADLDAATASGCDTLVDLPTLVDRVLTESDPSIAAQTEPGPPVTGDEALLRQAISAAVAFTVALATEQHDTEQHDNAPHAIEPHAVEPPDAAPRVGEPAGGNGPGVRVSALHSVDGWTLTATAPVSSPVTPERLFAIRVPHPADAEATRTAPLALLLARAIAVRHGGGLESVGSAREHTITLRLPSG